MAHDEILQEVWAAKDSISEKFGNDVGAMMEDSRSQREGWEAKGFRFVVPKTSPPTKPAKRKATATRSFRGGSKRLRSK